MKEMRAAADARCAMSYEHEVARAFLWCRHCGQPHQVGLARCPQTNQPLETRVHKLPKPAQPGAPASVAGASLAAGELIDGRYRIQKLLGEGATSRVFLAEDTALDTVVAVKIQRASAAGRGLRRFEQEARLMIAITHPNVCRVLGFGKLADGRPYLVMEALLRGGPLLRYTRRRKALDQRLALSITAQLLAGLQAAHQLGIIHRDVKPGNIFMCKRPGAHALIKLLDFGIAKAPPERAVVWTRPGYVFGTPGYVPPEVLSGNTSDVRSDIWSVGVVLYEMLCGTRPFRDPVQGETLFAIVCEPPRSLAILAPQVEPDVIDIVETALDVNPRKRFQTATAFLTAVETVMEELGPPSILSATGESLVPPSRTGESMLPVLNLDGTPTTGVSVLNVGEYSTGEATTTTGSRRRP
jgi:serine/threonine-protein kinase